MTNEIAQIGFAASSSVYERGRPDYPAAVIDGLMETLRLTSTSRLLDLATGTGKLARGFIGRVDLVAAEPSVEMCTEFARIQPGVPLVGSVGEVLPFADGSLDAVTIGTAFHWFDGPVAVRELHRVLKPGGRVALLWLQRDESEGWVNDLVRLVDTYRPANARRYAETPWQAAWDTTDEAGRRLFTPLEFSQSPFEQPLERDAVVQRTASTSFVAAMDAEQRAEVLERVRDLLDTHEATRGRDVIGVPHQAEVYWAERIGS